jgi:hypothetical protein
MENTSINTCTLWTWWDSLYLVQNMYLFSNAGSIAPFKYFLFSNMFPLTLLFNIFWGERFEEFSRVLLLYLYKKLTIHLWISEYFVQGWWWFLTQF